MKGFVKEIRKDKKLDITLHAIGCDNFNDPNTELIYNALVSNKGLLAIIIPNTKFKIK